MMIDEGLLSILRSANGAYSCKRPPIPKNWNSIDRPYVALLLPGANKKEVFRFVLSQPSNHLSDLSGELETADLDSLPALSIIEVKHNGHEYSYYRLDPDGWKKVAESKSPFMVEVFSHGTQPIIMDVGN